MAAGDEDDTALTHRRAAADDAPVLAEINRQLIEDEWGGGGMSLDALEERMLGWITEGDYHAIIFEHAGVMVAYALVSIDTDSAYIRHFYVMREQRGSGLGRRALALLLGEVIPPGVRVTLDVLASNRGGYEFWRAAGFSDYTIRMERLPAGEATADDAA